MRGSVPGQIAGAIGAWRSRYADARAIVCPAYPRMGRTVQASRLFVHGEPVETHGDWPRSRDAREDEYMTWLIPASPSITLADAATDDDLIALATAIARQDPLRSRWARAVWPKRWQMRGRTEGGSIGCNRRHGSVGARGADGCPTNPRILLLVTSLNPVSHVQVSKTHRGFP